MYRAFFGFRSAWLFLLSAPVWAQISLVHVTPCGPQTFPASTCTIPATGSGNLLVVAWMSNNGGGATTITGVTDNAGNNYAEVSAARAVDSVPNNMTDLWYAKNSLAGTTVLTINPNPTATRGTAVIWEFSGVDPTAPLDQMAVLNSQAATTTPSGAPVATTSASEVVISVANVQGTVTGMLSGNSFTGDSTANGNGWAHLIASATGTYAAQWTNSASGTYASSTVSFKAAGSAGVTGNPCDLTQDGSVTVADVQAATNMDLGLAPCTANIYGAGVCNIVVVQRVTNAAMGAACITGTHTVSLSWAASTSSNVVGYNIYRRTTPGGSPTRLNASPVAGTSYTDTAVQSGQTYYYTVTAVDSSNNESVPSTPATAIVPTP